MPEPKTNKGNTLASRLLQEARDSHWTMSVYLVSGFQLKGEVVEFDEEAILFNHKSVHQLVMRSGIASMYPLSSSNRDANEWWRSDVSTLAEG
jgi:RNA chaperone Hfq